MSFQITDGSYFVLYSIYLKINKKIESIYNNYYFFLSKNSK